MSLNLARIDLVSLRLAVLCAELGSLSAAAERAHCSVSTASHRLSCLEQSFGTPLFTRGPRGLSTTGRGDLLVRHGRAILQHVEFMHQVVRGGALPSAI
jgi:DNA-binding transcriptional LysR family regulator